MIKKSLIVAASVLALSTASTANAGDQYYSHNDPSGILLGGIIGGIIGNNIGNSKGNGAAGAVIGALIGNNITNHRHYNQHPPVTTSYRREVVVVEPQYVQPQYVQPQNFDPCLRYHKPKNRRACRQGQNLHQQDHAFNYGYNNQRRYSHNNPWWD